jgi:hypothetical protein
MSLNWLAAIGQLAFMRTPKAVACGNRSRSSPSRFGSRVLVRLLTPVTFPSGLLRLVTRPCSTGSALNVATTGIVVVAALAANAAGSPPVAASTVTGRPASSAASAGSRSYCPFAQRYSIVTFRPSAYPVSASPRLNAAVKCALASGDLVLRNPITGIAACCARAATGHAAATPPSSVMNSRRFMCGWPPPGKR